VRAEQVTGPLTYHGEGPVWTPEWGLRFVDMFAGDVCTLRPDGGVDRLHVGTVAAFLRPRRSGGYVVGLERGLGLADDADAPPAEVLDLPVGEGARMNEGGCDVDGALWAGSMRWDQAPGGGRLFRVDRGEVEVVDTVTISNGIAFTAERGYYADTKARRIDVVDPVARTRRPWCEVDGFPDGLTVDAEGRVWVALFGGGRVLCLSPDGEVLDEVRLPVALVTACAFGGDDLRDLYVTTSREDLADPEPEAGALFRVRTDVPGTPVLPYAG